MGELLQAQIDYYDARAGEYDDFWYRRGSYRLDGALARAWRQDADDTLAFVREQARGSVLELAAGTGIWLSHVPDDRFASFWTLIGDCLAPGGRVVLVDSRPHPDAKDTESVRVEDRTIADGRTFQIIKRYWTPMALKQQLAALGWIAHGETTTHDLMLRAVVDHDHLRGPLGDT